MDIDFQTLHVGEALVLMLLGMVGIFVVMGLIMGVVFLLNRAGRKDKKKKNNQQ